MEYRRGTEGRELCLVAQLLFSISRVPLMFLPGGLPNTQEDYLKNLAKSYPVIAPIVKARAISKQLVAYKKRPQIGADGLARDILSVMNTISGRSHPLAGLQFFSAPALSVRSSFERR